MRRKSERTKSTSSPVRSSDRTTSSRRSSRRGKSSPTKSPEPAESSQQADQHTEDKVSETEIDGGNEKTRDSSSDREGEGRQSRGRRQIRRTSKSDDRSSRTSKRKIDTIQEEEDGRENGESSPVKGATKEPDERRSSHEDVAQSDEKAAEEAVARERRSSKSEENHKKETDRNESHANRSSSPVECAKEAADQAQGQRSIEQEADREKSKSPSRESKAEEAKSSSRREKSEHKDAVRERTDEERKHRSRKESSERRTSDSHDRKPREQREHRKSKSDESGRSSEREHRNSRSSTGKDHSVEKDNKDENRRHSRSSDGERSKEREREHKIRRSTDKSTAERNEEKENKQIHEEKENKQIPEEPTKVSKDAEGNKSEKAPPVRKRRWMSRKASDSKPQVLAISTDSLKNLISDVEPVPLSDVKLESSPEPEERRSKSPSEEESDRRDKEKSRSNRDRRSRERDTSGKREEKGLQNANRKISIVPDDGKLQRPPSPPRNVTSNILYITNLVRPFTVLQLKGLLARTGKIVENGFWMDRIKSQCYVKYETEDQATETRHALHGVRWPTSNPKCLNVDFDTEEAMQKAIASTMEEAPRFGADNARDNRVVGAGWDARERFDYDDKKDVQVSRPVREWDVGKKEEHEREMERGRERDREHRDRRDGGRGGRRQSHERDRDNGRDRQNRSKSASPARKFRRKENDPPLRLLDDLFRKTKVTPCIYWLPLTPEQIAEKEEARRKHMEDLEKRTEEIRKERENREREREKEREREREQRERERERERGTDKRRERSNDRSSDRRRSRSRDRRRY